MTVVVDRRDPRWNDPVWRTENFLALCADHQLSVSEVAAYTEKSIETVMQWRSGRSRVIPTPLLRLMMLELALGGRDALA